MTFKPDYGLNSRPTSFSSQTVSSESVVKAIISLLIIINSLILFLPLVVMKGHLGGLHAGNISEKTVWFIQLSAAEDCV